MGYDLCPFSVIPRLPRPGNLDCDSVYVAEHHLLPIFKVGNVTERIVKDARERTPNMITHNRDFVKKKVKHS